MNVLVLHSELGVLRGGGENFTRNLFAAFAERGHRVAAAFVADHNGRYPLSLPPGIQPIPVPGWWSSSLGQATLSALGQYLPPHSRYRKEWDRIQAAINWRVFEWHKRRFQKRIESKFSERWDDFDAVYVHGDTALASMVACHRPTLLRLPGPVTAESAPMLQKIGAVCANGDALAQIRGFLGDTALELPVGLDNRLFRPDSSSVRSALGWGNQHRVIGYVGRLAHLKGVDLLAAAFRELSQQTSDVRLLIIGSGAEEKSIRSVLAKQLAQGLAHIEPDLDHSQLAQRYRAMDLLVMPSRYENFSNALLEAMACGVPFLASGVGGNRIMAESGAGWLFECGSASSLVARLKEILKNGSELKARGKIGLEYVKKDHTWSATAQRLEEIVHSRLGVGK